MDMWIRLYDAKCFAQYGRSRATLDDNGVCRDDILSLISAYKIKLWRCGNHFPKLAFKRHATDPLLSSSKQQAA